MVKPNIYTRMDASVVSQLVHVLMQYIPEVRIIFERFH